MKRFMILMLVAGVLWCGYWFVAANATKTALSAWFDDRAAAGWSAENTAIDVHGFPYRLDTTITEPALGDPRTGVAWEADFFQILALAYKPNHIIAVWPHTQLIATPYEKYTLNSAKMRASLVLGTALSLPLSRATLVADSLRISAKSGGSTKMIALNVAAELLPDQPDNTYRIGMAADGLVPAPEWRKKFDPNNILPRALTAVNLDLTASFDAPWDRFSIETSRPQPTALRLKRAKMQWGDLDLHAAGDLTVDPQGYATGQVSFKVKNWRDILAMATTAGVIAPYIADPLEQGLDLMSRLAGNPKTLDITLHFKSGKMSLGPIPLGRAPRFRIR